LFYGPLKAPNGPNYSRYQNEEYDLLYEALAAETNPEIRSELIRKADAWLMQEQTCVPLFYDEVLRVYPNYVEGVRSNALNALNLLQARLKH